MSKVSVTKTKGILKVQFLFPFSLNFPQRWRGTWYKTVWANIETVSIPTFEPSENKKVMRKNKCHVYKNASTKHSSQHKRYFRTKIVDNIQEPVSKYDNAS